MRLTMDSVLPRPMSSARMPPLAASAGHVQDG
jgi:hypothetical protein